ncbi:MAG: DUF4175 family protein [Myxococcota bacterium]
MKRSPDSDAVDRYLARLRYRAWAVHLLRAGIAAGGAGALAFALVAAAVGPVTSLAGAGIAWTAVAVSMLVAAGICLRPAWALRGTRAARLLDRRDPALVSAARSAVELAHDPRAEQAAPGLIAAHRTRVREALVRIPPAQVVPWSTVRHPVLVMGALGAAVAGVLVAGVDRAASGAYAMLHPDGRSDDGLVVAAVVGGTEARLVFPAHVDRSPVVLRDAQRIEAPQGTTVHYTIRPRVPAEAASLSVAGRNVRLVPEDDGRFRARFVVRTGGALRIRVQDAEGRWLEDPVRRTVRSLEDRAPRVALRAPESDLTVELEDTVPIAWEATDDVGLRAVELVIRTPSGEDVRRSLLRVPSDEHRQRAQGDGDLTAAEAGARPGDQLEVWVEATDGDMVSGPNTGHSEHRRVAVASEATRRRQAIAEFEETLNLGLAALADRLEREVPSRQTAARERWERVRNSGDTFARALVNLADQAAEADGVGGASDPSLYRAIARRVQRGLRREAQAHRQRLAKKAVRARLDGRMVKELEKDALLLSDLLGEARLEDAAAITREIESLRREMVSLVSELRRTESPEARRALRAAISRAEARMQELMGRLAAMGEDVPSDFINAGEMAQRDQEDVLESMRQALDRGDMDEVERQLAELEHRVSSLAEALGGAESEYAQQRFGPRQKAMAEAMDALAGLEAEQRKLAGRTDEVRRRAAEQALKASSALDGKRAKELAEAARKARERLDGVPRQALGSPDGDALMRAKQRLVDSADALEGGDLGEARRMAREAMSEVENLARDLELSALMFPGAEGRMGEAASAARQAAREVRKLRDDVERSIPQMHDFLGDEARHRMRGDADRQERAAEAAERLAQRFAQGPEGQPLSPQAAESMQRARETMQRAREHLRGEEPVDAARTQEDAARRLARLRDELEESQRSSGGGGGGGGGSNGRNDGRPDMRKKVRIPGADDNGGPMALRRKLLDAMREEGPADYREAVHKYYQELLR